MGIILIILLFAFVILSIWLWLLWGTLTLHDRHLLQMEIEFKRLKSLVETNGKFSLSLDNKLNKLQDDFTNLLDEIEEK